MLTLKFEYAPAPSADGPVPTDPTKLPAPRHPVLILMLGLKSLCMICKSPLHAKEIDGSTQRLDVSEWPAGEQTLIPQAHMRDYDREKGMPLDIHNRKGGARDHPAHSLTTPECMAPYRKHVQVQIRRSIAATRFACETWHNTGEWPDANAIEAAVESEMTRARRKAGGLTVDDRRAGAV